MDSSHQPIPYLNLSITKSQALHLQFTLCSTQASSSFRGQKINANFFCTKYLDNPSGHGRPHRKSWMSAPKSAFVCGPGDGEKLFDPGASGRKGQECPREIRTEHFMFMLFVLPRNLRHALDKKCHKPLFRSTPNKHIIVHDSQLA